MYKVTWSVFTIPKRVDNKAQLTLLRIWRIIAWLTYLAYFHTPENIIERLVVSAFTDVSKDTETQQAQQFE